MQTAGSINEISHCFFCIKSRFFQDNDINNYLKCICFEVGQRHCFEFEVISTYVDHISSFVGAKPK
jgi:putative transposase